MHDLAPLPVPPDETGLIRGHALAGERTPVTGRTVVSYVESWADRTPERIAVRDGAGSLTYAQLADTVRAYARSLLDAGCGPGDVVAVLGVRCLATVPMFLAIEAIGAIYLPVGTDWPEHRLAVVLFASGSRLVADPRETPPDGPADALTRACAEARVPIWRSRDVGPGPASGDHLARHRPGHEIRYIIYTSGSTGVPKGVAVAHQGLLNHVRSKIRYLSLTPDDGVALSAPLTFDISVWQMLAALIVGGWVTVVSDQNSGYARRLLAALSAGGATVAQFVPSLIRALTEELDRNPASGAELRLTRLLSIGEKLPVPLAAECLRLLPRTALINSYGPTECSDGVSHQRVTGADLDRENVPIGVPVDNCTLYVLRESEDGWRAVPPGGTGELFIGGAPVGGGYLNDGPATREAFFVDPIDPDSATGRLFRTRDLVRFAPDGAIEYLRRVDRQVKVSGVRVELGEVEAVLQAHPDVVGCAVVGVDRATGQEGGSAISQELVAYYVAGRAVEHTELARHLRRRLPPAMVPRRWVQVHSMPLTRHGKTDYRELRARACAGRRDAG
jgi:D-alanine--poly(phosphoribitol) ligase subunit 1